MMERIPEAFVSAIFYKEDTEKLWKGNSDLTRGRNVHEDDVRNEITVETWTLLHLCQFCFCLSQVL